MLIVKGLVVGMLQVALLAALLFIPAWTLNWPRAIQFLVVYCVAKQSSVVFLAIAAPASLEARLEAPAAKSQPMADRVALAFLLLAMLGSFLLIPFDVFHLHLLPAPSLAASVFGAALCVAGFGVVAVALYQNEFATPTVRDQSERGHALVDTGLYGHIRHPFYAGALVLGAGIALWLESYASVISLLVVVAALVARIKVEEESLREALPGYIEYMGEVRHRLIPFIW